MARRMFWHVPQACWHQGIVAGGTGNTNLGNDIVVSLVSTNPASNSAVPDDVSGFVVKRIIGQYMLQGDQDVAANFMVHNRVYPVTADAVSVTIRALDDADDAESDFLWHKVEPWPAGFDGDLWGSWQTPGNGLPVAPFRNGRHGDIDINVNRRIRDGQDLIWHTQFVAPAPPDDNTVDLFLWIRMLLTEDK